MKFKNFKRQKFMLCKMAWMREYCGITRMAEICPKGGGSYIKEHEHGGEVVNFKQLGKYYYGYVRCLPVSVPLMITSRRILILKNISRYPRGYTKRTVLP